MLGVQRSRSLDMAEELEASPADGRPVQQAGNEEIAVLLQARPQGVGVSGQRVGGPKPSEGALGKVEIAPAGAYRVTATSAILIGPRTGGGHGRSRCETARRHGCTVSRTA